MTRVKRVRTALEDQRVNVVKQEYQDFRDLMEFLDYRDHLEHLEFPVWMDVMELM